MENPETYTFENDGGAVKSKYIIGDVNQNTTIQHISATQLPLSPTRFGTMNSDPNFTGRSEEMNFLDQCFEMYPYIVVVCGMGGIGKTSLVRKYVDREKFDSHNVIWINAKQVESIRKDFESLASIILNVRGQREDFKSTFDVILSKLCKLPTLIVLDNVDDEDVKGFVLKYVLNVRPSGDHRPHFVVTSRIQWMLNSVHFIPLRVLGDNEAIGLVTKLITNNEPNDEECSYNDSTEDKEELIKILQCFPLAIRQATAHINYQRVRRPFSISDYINEYNSCSQEILDCKHFQDGTFLEYEETTFTTWTITINAIARHGPVGHLALRILQIMGYFEADHIRRDIFFHLNHPFTDNQIDEKDIISAVALLIQYSMIQGHQQQSVLSIHRLVQKVMKIDLENKDQSRTALRDGLDIIQKMLKQQNFENASQTFEHGVSLFISVLAKQDLAKEFSFFPSVVLGRAFDCDKLLQFMTFSDLVLPNAIKLESAIGIAFPNIGEHTKAFQIFQEKYAKRVQIFGANHPGRITIKTSIGASYTDEGKHAEALQMFQEVYAKRVQIFGADHPHAIMIKSWIAVALYKMGKHDEALQMFQEVYAKRVQIFGVDQPETIAVELAIANSFLKMGKYVHAMHLYRDVYGKQVYILGDDHPDTITTESWIANSLFKMGQYTEALKMFQEVYAKRVEIFSADHPDSVKIRFWIAVLFLQMEKYAEASQMFQDVYIRGVISHSHFDTITMESSITVSNLTMGKYAETLEIFEDIYAKLVQIFGGDHQHTVTIKSWITVSFHKMEKYAEASHNFEDINAKLGKIFYDQNHCNDVAMCMSCWINYLQLKKNNETEALQMNRQIYEIQYVETFTKSSRLGRTPIITLIPSKVDSMTEEKKFTVEATKTFMCGCIEIIIKRMQNEVQVRNGTSKSVIFTSFG